jgi:pericentriolar material 1 protein
MTASQPQTIVHDGELFSFDKMREKIYSEVAALISQNEARPFFLLNLFRELQYLKDKNARDQALKSIFNINNRNQQFIKKDNEMTMRPKQKQQNIQTDLIPNNEQDDFISYKYRMTKSEHIYKETDSFKQSNSSKANDDADTSRTQSPFESDSLSNTVIFVRNSPNGKQPLKIKYPSKKNESDLQHKYQKNNDIDIDFSRSSSSSIMGIQESTNHSQNMKQMQAFDKFIIDQNKIENEVKNFISKIIKSIKVSDDNITDCEEEDEDNDELESNEDEDDDYISLDEEILNNAKPLNTTISKQSSSKNSYKFARCDSDYLNEIIDKVLNVLKQSSDHHDYLRLYQQQLTSYLKEALNKYENKRLIKCMEDILIDISDILYNELTFYSIMNHTNTSYSENVRNKFQQQIKMSRLVSKNIDIPSENNKFMTTKNVQTMDKSNGGDNLNLNLIKSLVRKNNQKANFNREEVEEEDGDSSVASFQSKSNINTISSSNNMSRTTSSEQTSKSTSRTNSVDSTPALSNNDDTIYYFDENAVKTKLNCFKSNHKSDLTSKLESNYSEILNRLKFILNEKSEELTSLMKTSQTSEKLLLVNDDDDTKEQEINENEIKIEDLPDKLTIAREVALSTLDSIIMESISDGLVGDPNNLPLPQPTHEPNVTNTDINEPLAHIEPIINSINNEKNSEDENELQHSNRSSSSKSSGNSDQFIMISETSNISSDQDQDQDQVLVDEIKKSDEETQSVNMLENITITELNEAN